MLFLFKGSTRKEKKLKEGDSTRHALGSYLAPVCQVKFKRPTHVIQTFLDGPEAAASILGVVPWGAWLPVSLHPPKTDQAASSRTWAQPGHQETFIKMNNALQESPGCLGRQNAEAKWYNRESARLI